MFDMSGSLYVLEVVGRQRPASPQNSSAEWGLCQGFTSHARHEWKPPALEVVVSFGLFSFVLKVCLLYLWHGRSLPVDRNDFSRVGLRQDFTSHATHEWKPPAT